MKRNTFAKLVVMAAAVLALVAWIHAHSYRLPEPPKFNFETELNDGKFDECQYERLRANLYDAALDLCMCAAESNAYVWTDGVDEQTKRIIMEYRVPSLKILLCAIESMDEFGGDLADSFDLDFSPLGRFDVARAEYERYIGSIK